ncbi:MAG TPA: autotransporter-associated beta strand repeat-containing protein, partial [Prosthecobacter sp.]
MSSRFLAAVVLPCVMTTSLTTSTTMSAATLYWDADGVAAGNAVDGSGLGGTGIWNTTALNWWDLTTDTAWPNTTADTAIFAGQPGEVTLDGTLQAGGLVFESDGHILTGGTLMLGGAATIDVTALDYATIRSNIAGTSGLIKTGDGMLRLALPNDYSGDTVINGGTLEVRRDLSLGTGGNIVLDGGTLRALGDEFYSLRNITVGAGGGTLDVTRTASNFGTMRLRGEISGAGTLTKTGFGELRLDGDSSGFTGPFVLDRGIVRIKGTFDRGAVAHLPILGASSLTVRSGGELILDYSSFSTTPAYSFVNEDLPVHLEGGRLQFLSNNATGTGIWTQNVGDLSLDRGSSRVYLNRTSSGSAAVWSFGNLTRAEGSTISFDWTTSAGTLGAPGLNPRILFESLSEPVNDGIMGGWALVNLTNFATYDPVLGVAIATYTSSDITTAGATDNVEMSQGNTVISIGDTTINALKWSVTTSTGVIEQADGSTLTIDTGGILTLGNTNKQIRPESGGSASLTANGGALYIHNAQGTLTINSNIVDGDMPTALVKTQAGSLTLNGANTYSGGTFINGASNVSTGSTPNQTYLGTGPVYVTRGILNLGRQGATTSTEGYSAFEGGSIYLSSSAVAYNTDGDRFTIDGSSSFGGVSASGMGLNSLTYVDRPVSAGGEIYLAPGATIIHGNNSSSMATGIRTIVGLPSDMRFYFGESTTQTSGSNVVVGIGTPWKGLGTDRNTRGWDLGTITVNGFQFELHGMLVPNQNGEGQSAYTLQLGNNTSGVTNGLGPIIEGAAPGPLTALVTGGIVRLEDDLSIFGDTTNGSLLTFVVTPGGTLELSQSNAMGSGTGIAAIDVLAGGTLQQFYSSTVSTSNSARIEASSSGINGAVVVRT